MPNHENGCPLQIIGLSHAKNNNLLAKPIIGLLRLRIPRDQNACLSLYLCAMRFSDIIDPAMAFAVRSEITDLVHSVLRSGSIIDPTFFAVRSG